MGNKSSKSSAAASPQPAAAAPRILVKGDVKAAVVLGKLKVYSVASGAELTPATDRYFTCDACRTSNVRGPSLSDKQSNCDCCAACIKDFCRRMHARVDPLTQEPVPADEPTEEKELPDDEFLHSLQSTEVRSSDMKK